MKQTNILNYYKALCKELNIQPLPINFKRVAKGGACISHDGKGKMFSIEIDLNNCKDVERGILHETAHQVLIEKNNNFSHNSAFKKLETDLIETYFYSHLSKLLYQ